MDVTTAAPYDRVACPHCQSQSRVKRTFGSYTIQRRLAWGGMSVVFVAYDSERDCEVAIKMLSDDYYQDPVRAAQFKREGELTLAVEHPNIVKAYHVDEAFGRTFIVMEWVRGETLEELLAPREPLPEAVVIQIGLQVIAGLEASRAAGLIHRDIKPGNILVGAGNKVKILDFGLSLETERGQAKSQEVFATPYYVSPEALEGAEEDFRSDIYSLGATLYHALLGRPPFETTSTEIAFLRETKKSIPPLRKQSRTTSKATALVVDKALAFLRSMRFSSYQDFATALENAGQGKVMPTLGSKRSQLRSLRKSRWDIVIAFVTGLIILGMSVAAFLLATKEEPAVSLEQEEEASQGELTAEDLLTEEQVRRDMLEARAGLETGDFSAAEAAFLRLYHSRFLSSSERDWAGFQYGLCALLDGRAGDAGQRFRMLDQRLPPAQTQLAPRSLIRELAFEWTEPAPTKLSEPVTDDLGDEEDMLNFARALRNWEAGDLSASEDFARFSELTLAPDFVWIEPYQRWAGRYHRDAIRLSAVQPNWSQLQNNETLITATEERILLLQGELETNGSGPRRVAEWWQRVQELKER